MLQLSPASNARKYVVAAHARQLFGSIQLKQPVAEVASSHTTHNAHAAVQATDLFRLAARPLLTSFLEVSRMQPFYTHLARSE